jgi:hypothetical protein
MEEPGDLLAILAVGVRHSDRAGYRKTMVSITIVEGVINQ